MSSLEDYKKQKAQEEQRRQGLIAKEIDKDSGLEINPYIPVFIAKAPWYLEKDHATLSHQAKAEPKISDDKSWYARGQRAGPAATKYRKGACENCGAVSHKTKDCLERPRKKGAKWTGKDIQADEVVQKIELGFDGKRDRWNGYDSQEHIKLVKEWEMVEEKRRLIRTLI
jgi:pre-mRNA-processing factor SLU7